LLHHQALFGRSGDALRFSSAEYVSRNAHVFAAFAAARAVGGGRVHEISLIDLMCPNMTCQAGDPNGLPLYLYTGHPSRYAVLGMAPLLAPVFATR
jgi:hypothetical protein